MQKMNKQAEDIKEHVTRECQQTEVNLRTEIASMEGRVTNEIEVVKEDTKEIKENVEAEIAAIAAEMDELEMEIEGDESGEQPFQGR